MGEPFRPEDILAIRMVAEPQLSPDGRLVAFTVIGSDRESNQTHSAIWIAAADGLSPAERLTQAQARDQRPRFSPDGTRLAFLSNRERDWRNDLFVIGVGGGEARRVAKLPRGIVDFDWSPDGRRFALVGRPAWPADPDLPAAKDEEETRKRYQERVRHLKRRFRYRLDGQGQLDDEDPQIWVVSSTGEDADLRQVTDGPQPAARPRWAPDGTIAFLSNREPDWWRSEAVDVGRVDVTTGAQRRLTPGGATVTAFAIAPNGELAYVAVGRGAGSLFARNHHLFVAGEDRTADIDRSVWANILADMSPPREAPDLQWTADGAAVYTAMSDGGRLQIGRAAASGGRPQVVVGGDRAVLSFSVGPTRLAFVSTSLTDPVTVRTAGLDGGDERVVFEPNAWLRERALGEVRHTPFEHGGRTVDSWTLLPPGYDGGRVPTILNIHGGPHAAWGWTFPHLMQALAGQGYAVLFCNSPGSQSYDEEYSTSLTGRWGELDFPYWMAAVDRAIAEGVADPEQLGVSGASYGGFATLWVIGHTDRFRAALAMRPVAELQGFYGSSDIGWNFGEHSFSAEPWEDEELFRRLSPITYIETMTTPLRLIASTGDLRTPLEQAEQVYMRLLKLGRDPELLIFHGEPHGLTTIGKPWNRVRHMRAMLEWWERHLGKTAGKDAETQRADAAPANAAAES